jgi:hypothetical protein
MEFVTVIFFIALFALLAQVPVGVWVVVLILLLIGALRN